MTGFGQNGIEIRGINATIDTDVVANYTQVGNDRIKPWPILTPKKQLEYLKRIQQGETELVDEFYLRNLGLIYYMVDNDSELKMLLKDESDRLSYAMEGFMYAVKSYDVNKGAKFDSYACMCMEWYAKKGNREVRAIETGLSKGALHKVDRIVREMNKAQQVAAEEGVTATPEDLAEILNMPVEEVRESLELGEALYHRYSLDGIQEKESSGIEILRDAADADRLEFSESGWILDGVYVENPEPDSYIQYRYGEKDRTDERIDPVKIVDVQIVMQDDVDRALSTLTDREEFIIRQFYGIGTRHHTQEEIAQNIKNYSTEERYKNKQGVSPGRVGQIRAKAERKLRHFSRSKYLLPALRQLRTEGEEYPIKYKKTVIGDYPPRRDVISDKDEEVNITLSTELLRNNENDRAYPTVDDSATSYDDISKINYPFVDEMEAIETTPEMPEEERLVEETVADEAAEPIKTIEENTNEVAETSDSVDAQLRGMMKEYSALKTKQADITSAEQALDTELSTFASQRKGPEERLIRARGLLANTPDSTEIDRKLRASLQDIIRGAEYELGAINDAEAKYREKNGLSAEANKDSEETQKAREEMKARVEGMIDDLLEDR